MQILQQHGRSEEGRGWNEGASLHAPLEFVQRPTVFLGGGAAVVYDDWNVVEHRSMDDHAVFAEFQR